MMVIMSTQPLLAGKLKLDRSLESAVILGWRDLMPGTASGQIHIEYHLASNGSADGLEIWLSTVRGYWKLICGHGMSRDSSRTSGVQFVNGYSSATLAHILELIVQQQDRFSTSSQLDRPVLIQVQAPTLEEVVAANNYIGEVFGDIRPSQSN
jgi:hypothetical protein